MMSLRSKAHLRLRAIRPGGVAGGSLAALAWATAASAQAPTSLPPPAAQPDLAPATSPAPQAAPGAGVSVPDAAAVATTGEIVVTAQRRQERLVDVPIAITAVSGQQLANNGVATVQNLPQLSPALRIDLSGGFYQPTIRGVGSSLAGPGQVSNVALYVDGFYVPDETAADFQLLSVTSVDVLKGPQGTLFGRNATGGAIQVNTRDPSQTTSGTIQASYGSFDRENISFYGTTGLAPNLSADVTGFYEHYDGFVKNIATGDDDGRWDKFAIRSKILYTPTDWAKFTLTYEHAHASDGSAAATNSYNGLSAGSFVPGVAVPTDRYQVANGSPTSINNRQDSISLKSVFDLKYLDLTSYSQYRNDVAYNILDYDGTQAPFFADDFKIRDRTVTQEFDFSSKPGYPLSYVVGFFYYYNSNIYNFADDVDIPAPTTTPPVRYTPIFYTNVDTRGYAAFADGTYRLFGHLYLTAGVRYSADNNKENFNVFGALPDGSNFVGGAARTFYDVTPRGVIRWEFDRDQSVYASINKGYKSGFLPASEFSTVAVRPEEITAYEVGYKYADRRFRFDASAYYYDYSNLQVASYVGVEAIYNNAAKSTIYGGEASFSGDLGYGLSANLGGAYIHAKYDDFPGATQYIQAPPLGLFGTLPVSAAGNDLPRAPQFTLNAGLDYHHDLMGGRLALHGGYYYTTKFYFESTDTFVQNGYGLLNAKATWTSPNGRTDYSLYGNNLTDARYLNQVLPGSFAIQQTYGEPIAFGGSVAYHF